MASSPGCPAGQVDWNNWVGLSPLMPAAAKANHVNAVWSLYAPASTSRTRTRTATTAQEGQKTNPVVFDTTPVPGRTNIDYLQYSDTRAAKGYFLWLNYTAPHARDTTPSPKPPFDCRGTAQPAPRHARAFDSEPLPRPPGFNELDVSDKPAEIRNRPRLTASQVADIQRRYRCELESLLSVDDGVKRVVDTLTARGELDSTLVVFTSDNGFFHGGHRLILVKRHIYEESIRVPLMIRGPGIPQAVTVNDLSINADLAPTIVETANANPGLIMDGRSLIPMAQLPGIEAGRELLIEEPTFAGIRTERYMYAEHRNGEKELYDLTIDPFEMRSRHDLPAYAPVMAQLAARLHELQNCAGASCRAHGP